MYSNFQDKDRKMVNFLGIESTLWNTQVKSGNNKAKANKTECE